MPSLDGEAFRAGFREWAGIDLRSLALFRIFLALAVFADVLSYLKHVDLFLSDSGIYPRSASMGNSTLEWSLFYISGHWSWSLFLLTIMGLAAAALLVGYRTRLATVVCWVLAVSLAERAGVLTSGADMQLRLLLFWPMFLPLGAKFSVDAALSRESPPTNSYASVATFALMIQVACLYFFGALYKSGVTWTETYDAVYYSLHMIQNTSPLAPYISSWTEFLYGLTIYVYYLELYVVVLLFFPVYVGFCRLVALPLLISLHIGFALLLAIGIFPLVSIAGLMVFVPGLFWDRVLARVNDRPSRRGIAIYYDRDCEFCRKICRIFRSLSLPESTPIEPAQDDPDIGRILERENSWIVRDANGMYRTRWDAVAYIWRRSPLLWPLGCLFLPSFMHPVGDRLYGMIASNRGALGRLTAKLLPLRQMSLFHPYRTTQAALLVLLAGVLAWNVYNLPSAQAVSKPQWFNAAFHFVPLFQRWSMYAPNPLRHTYWAVVEGELADGTKVDLMRGLAEAPTLDIPSHGYMAFPDDRMRKFFKNVSLKKTGRTMGRYYCRNWIDNRFGIELESVTFYRFTKRTPPPGESGDTTPVEQNAYRYECS